MNLRQGWWLELLKDYNISLLYHPGKDNVIADAISRLSIGSETISRLSMKSVSHVEKGKRNMVKDIHQLINFGV